MAVIIIQSSSQKRETMTVLLSTHLGRKKCQPRKITPSKAHTLPMIMYAKPMNGFLSPKKEVPEMMIDLVPPYARIS